VQLANEPEDFRKRVAEFIDDLVSHYLLDDGKLVVAHAGMKESMQGRGSGAVREFALFGETTGETDEFGLPVRYNWAAEYRGAAAVVYGHTPVPEPEWLNRTINIDTGCVFGGKLTALRYPERELISVPAKQTYAEPRKAFLPPAGQAPVLSAQQQNDDLLDLADVIGKRIVSTRLHGNVTIREENGIAALEVMSRFESQVADLPAAHDVAVRDQPGARIVGTPGGSIRLLSSCGCAPRCLRGKAYGFACRRHYLSRRRCSPKTFRCGPRRHRHLLHTHRAEVFRRHGFGS
jgi:diadenosine tetraphosphatase ApaH/serine/threonine PP2A family protein phosphatase